MSKTKLGIALTILLGFGVIQAQEAKEQPRHPGDIIKLEVKFDGPDARKIKSVSIGLSIKSAMPENQRGFRPSLGSTDFPESSPNTFQPEIKIPEDAATGEYNLTVSASAEAQAGAANYVAGKDFELHTFRIDNPRTFTPPKIKVTER